MIIGHQNAYVNNLHYHSRSTPIESLHTILLGPYKYLIRSLMAALKEEDKMEILSKIAVFPWSGIKSRLKPNICMHSGSLVGRDFKVIAQISLYLFRPYLSSDEAQAWIYLSKVV